MILAYPAIACIVINKEAAISILKSIEVIYVLRLVEVICILKIRRCGDVGPFVMRLKTGVFDMKSYFEFLLV